MFAVVKMSSIKHLELSSVSLELIWHGFCRMCNLTNTQGISIGSEPRNVWNKPSLGGFQVLEICTQRPIAVWPTAIAHHPRIPARSSGEICGISPSTESASFHLRSNVLHCRIALDPRADVVGEMHNRDANTKYDFTFCSAIHALSPVSMRLQRCQSREKSS